MAKGKSPARNASPSKTSVSTKTGIINKTKWTNYVLVFLTLQYLLMGAAIYLAQDIWCDINSAPRYTDDHLVRLLFRLWGLCVFTLGAIYRWAAKQDYSTQRHFLQFNSLTSLFVIVAMGIYLQTPIPNAQLKMTMQVWLAQSAVLLVLAVYLNYYA